MFCVFKWQAVGLWSWDIQVDNCAICRNHIMDLCIECQASSGNNVGTSFTTTGTTPTGSGSNPLEAGTVDMASASDECTVAWGKCNVL